MLVIVGCLIVLAGVFGGYMMEHGNLALLVQPAEVVIIYGAALGGLIIATPISQLIHIFKAAFGTITAGSYSKKDYIEVLVMLNQVFTKIRKEGLIAIEKDLEDPKASPLFSPYKKFLKNHHATMLVMDTLRTIMLSRISPNELDTLLEAELEEHHEHGLEPSHSMNTVAESLPGLGIVAAVLGIVITMTKISEPPEVLGHHIGAALVGTFLGVLTCYGFLAPLAKNMQMVAEREKDYLNVLKVTLVSFVGGVHPTIAIEFGRRVVPGNAKPTYADLDKALFGGK